MTRAIEEIRLDVLRLAVTSRPEAEALDWAATAMLLIEEGPTPVTDDADNDATPEAEAQPITAPEVAAEFPPRMNPLAEAPIATNNAAPPIEAARADALAPGPAPQPAGRTGRPGSIDEAIAREMFDSGATFAEIGARFGVSTSGAVKFAERRGWPQRRARTPAAPEPTPPPAQGYRMAQGVPVPAGPGAGTPITHTR
jgi:hypothetical protein